MKLSSTQMLIELSNVSKFYGQSDIKTAALSNIDFSLYSGEMVAIIGASGSGKTTLMHIIGLLDSPTSGQYFLRDQPIKSLSADELSLLRNKTFGFVFQQFFLLPRLSVADNVGLPLHYRGLSKNESQVAALEILQKVGLEEHAHKRPSQLSGGQQQRVAIARALVGKPAVILADEPTGSLDSHTSQKIMDLFIELNKNENVTIIIVTHDLHIAQQCPRIVRIQDGKIII